MTDEGEEEKGEGWVGGAAELASSATNTGFSHSSPTSWKLRTGVSSKFTQLMPRGSRCAL